jgi:hypothetical protein
VAYLSTDLGVLASYFYFVAHTAYYCMSAIHLNGNIWIHCLDALVSESCESMIGNTADLGKCLYDAKLWKCFTHVYMKVSNVWEIPSCGDDVVNKTMVWVVATVVHVSANACRASRLLYCFHAYYSYCEGLS